MDSYKLNNTHEVAVSTNVFWQKTDKDTPRGVKLQLLGSGGVASYGLYFGESFYVGWCPLPKVPEGMIPHNFIPA